MFVTRARALVPSHDFFVTASASSPSLSRFLCPATRALVRSHDFSLSLECELSFALRRGAFFSFVLVRSRVSIWCLFFSFFFLAVLRSCGRHLRSARKGCGGAGVLWLPRSMVGSQCDSRSGGSTFGIVRARLWYDATVPGNCSAVRAGEWYE